MKGITIHAEPAIEWQARRTRDFIDGLMNLGFTVEVTRSQYRQNDNPAILFGTTRWKGIEALEGDWLLVDRASYGDPDSVSLVWNGHGRRGNHMVPYDYTWDRWQASGVKLAPWVQPGGQIALCGQTAPYCETSLEQFYEVSAPRCDVFRSHPQGGNPTDLPTSTSLDGLSGAITLNSSVAIDLLIAGIPPVVEDPGGMAYMWQDRELLFKWLAWTQWTWKEIADGGPIAHLFDQA